jgi:hypothetical protein
MARRTPFAEPSLCKVTQPGGKQKEGHLPIKPKKDKIHMQFLQKKICVLDSGVGAPSAVAMASSRFLL